MDTISEQAKFLHRHGIDSEEQLISFRVYTEQQIVALTEERNNLSDEKRHAFVHVELKVVIDKQINEFSVQLKSLRKDIKLCNAILARAMMIANRRD